VDYAYSRFLTDYDRSNPITAEEATIRYIIKEHLLDILISSI